MCYYVRIVYTQHEDLSKKIFEKIYLRLKASFVEYGFTPEDVTFIQEMIEHDDITKVSRFAERRFLYEVRHRVYNIELLYIVPH